MAVLEQLLAGKMRSQAAAALAPAARSGRVMITLRDVEGHSPAGVFHPQHRREAAAATAA